MIIIKPADDISLIQGVVIKTIDDLQLELNKPFTKKDHVHRIRVAIKKIRAWLVFMKNHKNEFDWKKTDRHLLIISKSLGSNRDQQVMIETVEMLFNNTKSQLERTSIVRVKDQLCAGIESHSIDWVTVNAELIEISNTIKNNLLAINSIDCIIKDLRSTYKKVLKHGNNTFSKKYSYKSLHKLRKWIKNLNYQLSYVQNVFPDSSMKSKADIAYLGDSLGKIHDLILLKKTISQLQFANKNKEYINVVNNLIDKKIDTLFKKSKKRYKLIKDLSSIELISTSS